MYSEDGGPWTVFLVATDAVEATEAWIPRLRAATDCKLASLENILWVLQEWKYRDLSKAMRRR